MRGKGMFLIALLLALPLAAQEPAPQAAKPQTDAALPSVDQLLDKLVQATGGKAALETFTSRVIKGTFDIPAMGASGTWERITKAPDKGVTIVDVPGFGTIKNGYDGKVAWEDNPMVGLNEKSGVELARARRDSVFQTELRMRELYPKMVVKGKEKVGEKDAFVIEATPELGTPDTLYFDAESGLLVRQDSDRQGPQGEMRMSVYFEDYKDVDGVKIAFNLRQVSPEFSMSLKVTEVKHNVEIEDSKFEKPKPPPAPEPAPAPKPKPQP